MDERKSIERETVDKLRMHFVFNSLNGIHHMIGKDAEVAKEMVDNDRHAKRYTGLELLLREGDR